jgi:hypothetical protein
MISEKVQAALAEGNRWGVEQHGDELAPFAQMVADLKPRNVVEIGFRRGGTLAIWHELCSGLTIGVDLRDDFSVKRQADLEVAYPRLRCILADSHEAPTLTAVKFLLDGESVDLLFIDGDHSFAGTKRDYDCWEPRVQKLGIICFHDYQNAHYLDGITRFIDSEILSGERLKFIYRVGSLMVVFGSAFTLKFIVLAALSDPALRATASKLGMDARGSTPEQMRDRMSADIKKWAAVIDNAGIEKQ